MSYLENEQALQSMVGKGQMLEAFEKYYHDDVVMVEGTGEAREGKEASRQFEKEWLAQLKEVHGGGVTAITSNEEQGITITETWMEATFSDGNRMKMEEVSVKHWKGDQIIKERFYYDTRGMA